MRNKVLKGQSLFEITFALGLITLVLIAIVALASVSIKNSTFSHLQTVATRDVETTMEWLRSQKEISWSEFYAFASSSQFIWCFNELSFEEATVGQCFDTRPNTIYKREIAFTTSNPDIVQVVVNNYWEDANGFHEVKSTTDFTNY